VVLASFHQYFLHANIYTLTVDFSFVTFYPPFYHAIVSDLRFEHMTLNY